MLNRLAIPNFALPDLALPNLALPFLVQELVEILVSYSLLLGNRSITESSSTFNQSSTSQISSSYSTNFDNAIKSLFGQNFSMDDIKSLLIDSGASFDNLGEISSENEFVLELFSKLKMDGATNLENIGQTSLFHSHNISSTQNILSRKENVVDWTGKLINGVIFPFSAISQLSNIGVLNFGGQSSISKGESCQFDNVSELIEDAHINISNLLRVGATNQFILQNLQWLEALNSMGFGSGQNISQLNPTIIDNLGRLGSSSILNINNIGGIIANNIFTIDNSGVQIIQVVSPNQFVFDLIQSITASTNIPIDYKQILFINNELPIQNRAELSVNPKFGLSPIQSLFNNNVIPIQNLQDLVNGVNLNYDLRCIINRENIVTFDNLSRLSQDGSLNIAPLFSLLKQNGATFDNLGGLVSLEEFSLEWGGRVITYDLLSSHTFAIDWWLRPDGADWDWTVNSRGTEWIIPIKIYSWTVPSKVMEWVVPRKS